jgi:hypothetical protein
MAVGSQVAAHLREHGAHCLGLLGSLAELALHRVGPFAQQQLVDVELVFGAVAWQTNVPPQDPNAQAQGHSMTSFCTCELNLCSDSRICFSPVYEFTAATAPVELHRERTIGVDSHDFSHARKRCFE